MNKMKTFGLTLLIGGSLAATAYGAVTLPYTFSSSSSIQASQVNANDQALRDGINTHLSGVNPHNTSLSAILSSGNSCGSTNINFNGTNALNFEVENLASDPTCGSGNVGRLIWNTADSLFKICNGTSFVSIAGTGVNTLASVLSAGATASTAIDMNSNEITNLLAENRVSDPAAIAGRLYFRTDTSSLMVCNGTTCDALGGAQGLGSVLDVDATANQNIDMDGNELIDVKLEMLASQPAGSEGRVYYDTTDKELRFYNGSSWLSVGNTNTLADTLILGNSVGSTDINMNQRELKNARIENLGADPGAGNTGRLWFNTSDDHLTFDDGTSNHKVCSLDQAQTLTNKSISGSTNTITNIPDAALSGNVGLLDADQTFTGVKTFTTNPVISEIDTPSGSSHILTDGLANDTFTLNNAVQTLVGKTLQGFNVTGASDFNNFQAVEFRVENRGTDATPGNPGRIYYKTATGELAYDDGTNIRVLTANAGGSTTPWVLGGNSGIDDTTDFFGTTDSQDVVFVAGGTERLRLTDSGAIDTNLGAGVVKSDGSGILSSSTLTNADVSATADIARSKLAAGTPYSLLANSVSGAMSEIGPLTNGQILIGSTGAGASPATITGTANRVTVTNGAGSITLSGPQDLHTGATPVFNAMNITTDLGVGGDLEVDGDATISGLGTGLVHSNGSGVLSSSLLVNADVDAAAAISRSKLASGTANAILVNNGSGVSSEATALTYDGTLLTLGANTLFSNPFRGGAAVDSATGSAATVALPATPIVRLTDASLASIDGVAAGAAGQFLVLMNVTGNSVTINDEAGTAANRIRTGSGGAHTMQNNAAVFLIYDGTSSRWRMIGGAGGGRCSGTFSGTSITPSSGCTDQTWAYNGGSAQSATATPVGTLSGLAAGTRFTIIGTDDDNALTLTQSDASDGILLNGDAVLGRGQVLTVEYNATLARLVEVSRNF